MSWKILWVGVGSEGFWHVSLKCVACRTPDHVVVLVGSDSNDARLRDLKGCAFGAEFCCRGSIVLRFKDLFGNFPK